MMIFIKTAVYLRRVEGHVNTHIDCDCWWGQRKKKHWTRRCFQLLSDRHSVNKCLLFITFDFSFYSQAYYLLYPGTPLLLWGNSLPPSSVLLSLSLNPSFIYCLFLSRSVYIPLSFLNVLLSFLVIASSHSLLYLTNILPGIFPLII